MKLLKFITILFVVITLSTLIAHVLELHGKINLSQENYQAVQGIYNGWSWLGIFEIGAIIFTLTWTIIERKRKTILPFLLIALNCFVVSIIIFFILIFPVNKATINWTELPKDWQQLRQQWEYSHAIRAVLNLIGFCSLILIPLFEQKALQ